MTEPDSQPSEPRRRRRAVGPPGARPAEEPQLDGAGPESAADERQSPDDDERLLREVPPHHG